jgi:hypothetical protein
VGPHRTTMRVTDWFQMPQEAPRQVQFLGRGEGTGCQRSISLQFATKCYDRFVERLTVLLFVLISIVLGLAIVALFKGWLPLSP